MTTSTSPISPTESLSARLSEVRSRISAKSVELGLESQPTLIVVTKNHGVGLVQQLLQLGENQFGENRDQEAAPKASQLAELEPSKQATWHFVGQLQSNKVKSVLRYSRWLHTLDRESLLAELIKRSEAQQLESVNVFIEINLTDRLDRGGISPDDLIRFAAKVQDAQHLNMVGLMAVARPDVDPRVDFERVARLRERFVMDFPAAELLSMGMSGDYLQAMEYGATHLRIGTAITGHRPAQT